MEDKKRRIMIIGAGWEQAPLIKKAKDLGFWVLATHSNNDAEGFQYADAIEILEPRDINKAIKLFKQYQAEAVISDNDDYALYTVGIISQRFGLPGPNFAAISHSNNKKKSRRTCATAGIKQPEFYICNSYDDLLEGVVKVGSYPVIVKPVDNRGNFGINKVENETELKDAFFDAVSNSHSREFLVEKFIEGTLMIVDGFCFKPGEHNSLAVSSKIMLGGKKRVAVEIIYPADFDPMVIKKAMAINQEVVKALSYDFGFTHSEYILDDNGEIWLVESTNRGGGVYISSLIVPVITEIDILKSLLDSSFGVFNQPKFDHDNPMKNAAILSFFKFANGEIKSIKGLDEARLFPGVLRCDLSVKIGDIIEPITNDANRHGFIVATAKTKSELSDLIKQVKETVKLEYK